MLHYENKSTKLVSISKKLLFYVFGVVRIYGYLADQLQKKMMKNSKLKFSEYMQNISRSKRFGKFVLIVNFLAGNDYKKL